MGTGLSLAAHLTGEEMSIFDSIFIEQRLEDLPLSDPMVFEGAKASQAVTALVNILRKSALTPNKRINDLAGLGWDLIGNEITPCAISSVSQVSFTFEITTESERAGILVPVDFAARCEKDTVFCLGAMTFAISQARDFWNDKIVWIEDGKIVDGRQKTQERATAYESEFLFVAKKMGYIKFNKYQLKVMEGFPKGLDSRPDLWYRKKEIPCRSS